MKRQYCFTIILSFLSLLKLNAQMRILFVTSNQHFYGTTQINTSNHFEEIVVPYSIFTKAGYAVDFMSPEGGAIPIGYINTSDSIQKKYLYNSMFMGKLANTMKPSEIIAENYKAIFYSGGGAAMYGVPENKAIQQIASKIFAKNGVVSTICHGTAGIAYLKDDKGKSLYEGLKITGYPDILEEKEKEYYKTFPFAMDMAITNNGGNFVFSDKKRDGFYVVDGRFVTGQDPSSGTNVAKAVIALLEKFKVNENSKVVRSDFELVSETLHDYMEGTANGQPERLRKAFHSDFNLYTVAEDTLWVRPGNKYIDSFKPGEKSNRIGRIISIDIEKDAAIAKVEIKVPGFKLFTDYFLLLKYQGTWKIVHKSYSWIALPKVEK